MTTDADPASLTYEQALGELDALISQLERGDVPLEDAIRAYERGSLLAQRCAELLDRTEAAVTQLVVGPGGVPQERIFAAEGVAASGAQRTARPVAPPPPTAPARGRAVRVEPVGPRVAPPAPGLFPGLGPAPGDGSAEAADFDLDDIPF